MRDYLDPGKQGLTDEFYRKIKAACCAEATAE
jgi:hypothetical protein